MTISPVLLHPLATICIAGFLLLLSSAPRADGVSDEDRQRTGIETGAGGGLRVIGAYPLSPEIFDVISLKGFSVAVLSNADVFLYGVDPLELFTPRGPYSQGGERNATLRKRHEHSLNGSLYPGPLIWNTQKHGWEKLSRPPECPYFRSLHTATALADGKVLIAGGICESPRMLDDNSPYTAYTNLSLWDNTSQKWESIPALNVARIYHTASLLKDGSVLIVGGESDPALSSDSGEPVLNSVEHFRKGTVTALTPLHAARAKHTATVTADGRVLVAGGFDEDRKPIDSVEIWSPTTQRWQQGPALKVPRYQHTATLLDNGRVMVAGGIGPHGVPVGVVEIWDPSNNTWSTTAPLLLPLQGHSAALLRGGNVLVMGGTTVDNVAVRLAMLWDKARAQWLPAGSTMPDPGNAHKFDSVTLVPRADGSALVFGYPWIAQWAPAKKAAAAAVTVYGARVNHTASLLRDGRILLTGGRSKNAFLDWAEIYNPVSGNFSVTTRMHQARHSHTAVPLDDGRVVVAGGWVNTPDRPDQTVANSPEVWDPASGQWSILKAIRFEKQDWVHLGKLADGRVVFFASHEAFSETAPQGSAEYRAWIWNPRTGHVDKKQPRLKPHSKAMIAILPDGRVLRVGGNARSGQWKESAGAAPETWNIHSDVVTSLEAPPGLAGLHPTSLKSLVLRDGNVLVMDYTPPQPNSELRPAPVLLWNSKTEKWRPLPSLPEDSEWPVTELKDGTLITNKRWLFPNADSWSLAPAYPQSTWSNDSMVSPTVLQLASGQLLSLSTSAPHVAAFDEKSKHWKLRANYYLLRENSHQQALLPLADGRLWVSGMTRGHVGQQPTVQIWNPKDNSWIVTASPSAVYDGDIQAVELPSRRVLQVGLDSKHGLVCELWQPTDDSWKICGYLTSRDKPIRGFYLGTLEDGRAGMMIGNNEIMVFDENADSWVPMKLEWNDAPLTYGAPIRNGGFVARVYDSTTNARVDASNIASKYFSAHFATPLPESWGRWRGLSNVPTALFWHPAKREFAYIHRIKSFPLSSKSGMGKEAVLLADGCILSINPLSIFNPETGKVIPLADPGIGILGYVRKFALLVDGTVVITGPPTGIAREGAGFFYRKASCAGFAVLPGDDILMPGVATNMGVGTAASDTPAPAPTEPWWAGLRSWVWEYRWSFYVLFGAFLLYGLLRIAILPVLHKAANFFASRLLPREKVELLHRELPKPFTWGARAILYGLFLIVTVPMLAYYLQFKRIVAAQACADNPATCLDKETGILPSVPALEKTHTGTTSLPTLPCRYVGVWSSRQGQRMHRITLKDDGSYSMDPNEYFGGNGYTGFWAVQNNHMIWRHKTGDTGEPDINPILPESDTRFVLVEMNGTRTQYELIHAVKSKRCTP